MLAGISSGTAGMFAIITGSTRGIMGKRSKLGVLTLVVAVAAAAAFYFLLYTRNPIPADIQEQTTFSLYYPGRLPKGMKIDQESFDTASGVVTFIIKGEKYKLYVSQQAKPEGFDFEKLYTKQMSSPTKLSTPAGEAVIGNLGNNTAASITTVDSWIFMTSKENFPKKYLEIIARSLKDSDRRF